MDGQHDGPSDERPAGGTADGERGAPASGADAAGRGPHEAAPAELTHVDDRGRVRMVDVGAKPATGRAATARARFFADAEVLDRLMAGELPKGEALAAARIAGIQAAKDTARLIPLCHVVPLDGVEIAFRRDGREHVEVRATARCTARTGVEMEAMCAASVAALTLYDMCKAACRDARVERVELLAKSGGRSGTWTRSD